MNRVISIFSLILTIGLTNLSAQFTQLERDSMTMRQNQMQKDSVMGRELKFSKDNPLPYENKTHPDHRMPMNDGTPLGMKEDKNKPPKHKSAMDKVMPFDDKKAVTNPKTINRTPGVMPNLGGWPETSRRAVEETIAKYGSADVVSDQEIIWIDCGVWDKISINRMETKHSFPVEHTDMMQSTISYKVPIDKMDDLGRFDGSITFDRTQGTMSARCDVEANNILALNLAHEIVIGKLSVRQARTAFGNIVKEKMNGGNPVYMQNLLFSPTPNAADPDINTTGLTKADIMKGMKEAAIKK